MSDTPPEGWYPDPSDDSQLRWWDGARWTEHTHPAGAAEAAQQAGTATATAVAEQPTEQVSTLPGAGGGLQPAPGSDGGEAQGVPDGFGVDPGMQPVPGATGVTADPQPLPGGISLDPGGQGSSPGDAGAVPVPGGAGAPTAADPVPAADAGAASAGKTGPDRRLLLLGGAVVLLAIGFFLGRLTAPESTGELLDTGGGAATETAPDPGAGAPPEFEMDDIAPPGGEPGMGDVVGGDSGSVTAQAQDAAERAQAVIEACAAASPEGSYVGCDDRTAIEGSINQDVLSLAVLQAGDDTWRVAISVTDGPTAGAAYSIERIGDDVRRTCAPPDADGCEGGTW